MRIQMTRSGLVAATVQCSCGMTIMAKHYTEEQAIENVMGSFDAHVEETVIPGTHTEMGR